MCQVALDSRDIPDRSRIRQARADAGASELAENTRAICPVPHQEGEAEVHRAASVDGPRNLDAFHSVDARTKLLGMVASNRVVDGDAGKELAG